jgi:predicted NUDIX family phosphoesterase
MGEIILAVEEAIVQAAHIPQGVSTLPPEEIATIIKQLSANVVAMDRDLLEGNPTYRQLIPYISVHSEGSIFTAVRTKQGGDARLHGKRIIGFGGHANPVEGGATKSLSVVLRENAIRELNEELNFPEEFSLLFKGFINDYSTTVNKDHLGIYIQAGVSAISDVSVKETSVLVEAAFSSLDNLQDMNAYGLATPHFVPLESWSAMVLEVLIKNGNPTTL